MMARAKDEWRKAADKFAALQQREKFMVAAMCVVVVFQGGQTLWVDPPSLRASKMKKELSRMHTDLEDLKLKAIMTRTQLKDPDAARKEQLAQTRAQLDAADRRVHQYDGVLVSAARMPQLLQSLLSRHRGLELVAVQTLRPTPLQLPKYSKEEEKSDGKPAEAAVETSKGDQIQKHGIEIKVAGAYPDLLAYVAELEALPQKLIWGKMALAVTAYPRSELTLTLYTLSLETTWLVV